MLLESQFTLFSSYEEQLCSQCSQDRLNELNQNLTMHRASVNQIVVQLGEIEKGLIVSRQRKMVLLGMIQQADQQLCNNDDDVLVPSLRIVGLTTLRQQLSECKKKIIESKYVLEELSRKQKKTVEELQRYFEKV